MSKTMKLCRHCLKSPAGRPRGLCWGCFKEHSIRQLYPITSKHARREDSLLMRAVGRPDEPTNALPGTPEKVAVLERRARNKQELFHPDDAKLIPGELLRRAEMRLVMGHLPRW